MRILVKIKLQYLPHLLSYVTFYRPYTFNNNMIYLGNSTDIYL